MLAWDVYAYAVNAVYDVCVYVYAVFAFYDVCIRLCLYALFRGGGSGLAVGCLNCGRSVLGCIEAGFAIKCLFCRVG